MCWPSAGPAPRPRTCWTAGPTAPAAIAALLRNDHRVQAFAETELGPLLDHDARTGDNLMAILRAYLAAGGSKSDTARTTGLSRPTLYARLGVIERILGVPLEPVDSRTSLHAAPMIVDAGSDDAAVTRVR